MAVHELFAALGDPTRLHMVERLTDEGRMPLHELCADLPITRQASRKHVAVLEKACVVRITREGREQSIELEPQAFEPTKEWMERRTQQWRNKLAHLKRLVEEG